MVAFTEIINQIARSFFSGSVAFLILTVITALVIAGIIIFIIFITRWNLKAEFYDNINGIGFTMISKSMARRVKYAKTGEQIIRCLKGKLFLPTSSIPVSKNRYWFFRGKDGYWYNVIPESLDSAMGRIKLKIVDPKMRDWNVAIRRGIEERYGQKQTFLEKYGTMITFGIFIIIICITIYFVFDKYVSISNTLLEATRVQKEVLESARQLLGAVDTVQNGGSGLTPA